jgi:hypothetical protein
VTGEEVPRDKRKKKKYGKDATDGGKSKGGTASRSAASNALRDASKDKSTLTREQEERERAQAAEEELELLRMRGLLDDDPKRFVRGVRKQAAAAVTEGGGSNGGSHASATHPHPLAAAAARIPRRACSPRQTGGFHLRHLN